jgi:hypothetical protein
MDVGVPASFFQSKQGCKISKPRLERREVNRLVWVESASRIPLVTSGANDYIDGVLRR